MEKEMTLTEELAIFKANGIHRLPKETLALNDQGIRELYESNEAPGLTVGEQAPDFALLDEDGCEVRLSDELKKGPVVLIFYRGGWCPYCNIALKAYQRALTHVQDLGAQLIAISPQTVTYSKETAEKNGMTFPVLSDLGCRVSTAYKLTFKVPDYLWPPYTGAGYDLAVKNGEDTWLLPVTGSFIIDTSGVIRHVDVDADYKKRIDPLDLIAALRAL